MEKLKKHIHDDSNGLDYVLVGDYYIPDLQLPEESRPIGRWGRMHREYLQEYCPDQYNELLLSGKLWTYLVDLDEQAQNRLDCIFAQIKETFADRKINDAKHTTSNEWRCAAIEELEEAVLNRLISKILVGEVKKIDGKKVQEVKIIYNFVGEITE